MIHLNPVGVSADGTPCAAGEHVQQRAADQRRRVRAAHAAAQQPVGQQRADLVAGQLPAAADHRAPVGVRVLGDRDVGARPARPAP